MDRLNGGEVSAVVDVEFIDVDRGQAILPGDPQLTIVEVVLCFPSCLLIAPPDLFVKFRAEHWQKGRYRDCQQSKNWKQSPAPSSHPMVTGFGLASPPWCQCVILHAAPAQGSFALVVSSLTDG